MSVESDIKDLDKRVKALEQLVKTLMAASTVSKVEAARMISEATREMAKQASVTRQAVNNVAVPREEAEKLYKELKGDLDRKLEQQRKAEEAQRAAEVAAYRKALEARQRAALDKARAEMDAEVRRTIEQAFKTVVESRLATVEAMTRAALAKN